MESGEKDEDGLVLLPCLIVLHLACCTGADDNIVYLVLERQFNRGNLKDIYFDKRHRSSARRERD